MKGEEGALSSAAGRPPCPRIRRAGQTFDALSSSRCAVVTVISPRLVLPQISCLAALSPAFRVPSRASPAAKAVQLELRGAKLSGGDPLHHDPPAADRAWRPDLAGELSRCVVLVRGVHELAAVRVNPPLCLAGHRVSLVQAGPAPAIHQDPYSHIDHRQPH